jgi:hypothetical protein
MRYNDDIRNTVAEFANDLTKRKANLLVNLPLRCIMWQLAAYSNHSRSELFRQTPREGPQRTRNDAGGREQRAFAALLSRVYARKLNSGNNQAFNRNALSVC